MTRQEFISKRRLLVRRSQKRAAWWLIVFFGILLSCIPLTQFIRKNEEHPWLVPLGVAGVSLFLLVNLALVNWFARQEEKRAAACCPHCGKPLAGISAQIALATDNCGHCGKKVFSEGETRKESAAIGIPPAAGHCAGRDQ